MIREARSIGIDVTCETCPHYLFLTDRDLERIGAMAKCAPPLRSKIDQSQLWDAIGDITTIGSDHSPSPPALKQHSNFFKVWGGISSCQHLLALLQNSPVPQERVHALTSQNVAQRFSIAEKGGIEVGKDADLCLIDLEQLVPVTPESLHYRHKQTPYLGRHLPRVVRTILRGQTIFGDDKLVSQPIGKLVRPSRA